MANSKSLRLLLVAGTSIVSLPVYAQDVAEQSGATKGAQATAAAESSGLDEILVTAQRRSERMQDVPISITAATADSLERVGIRSPADLAVLAPAVNVSAGLGGAAITIRGVGGTGSGADESPNAVYIDGVYQPQPASLLSQFNNIERIEILKGPQGTLFGRNSSGGLIQIITRTPQFTPELRAEIGYGNYQTVRANAYVTGGLTDSIALDIAGAYEYQGKGWGKNLFNGRDAHRSGFEGVRSKLLWNVGPDTSVTASAMYNFTHNPSLQGTQILPGEFTRARGQNVGFYNVNVDSDSDVHTRQRNYALTIKHDFGAVTLSSITSRDVTDFKILNDSDLSPLPIVTALIDSVNKAWTQELQLASSNNSRFDWVAGLFYFHSNLSGPVKITGLAAGAPTAFLVTDSSGTTNSYAAYGQGTYEIVDGTRLTAGLRYTRDKRHIDFITSSSNTAIAPTVYPRVKVQDGKLTWRFAIDQRVNPDVLAYASYSRGFKSGLFNATNPGLPPVDPQTTDAYEVGLKSELFDHHLRFNVSAFYNKVDDIQLRGIPPGSATPIFYNAASGVFKGVDLELAASPFKGFDLQANASYLHARYGKGFTNALFFTVNTLPATGLTQFTGDASGNTAVYSPELAASLAAQYRFDTPAGEFTLAGTYSYNDGFYFDPQNRTRQASYDLFNASIAWRIETQLEVRLWANNVTKEKYMTAVQSGGNGDNYFPGAPRTFGMTIGWSFGGPR